MKKTEAFGYSIEALAWKLDNAQLDQEREKELVDALAEMQDTYRMVTGHYYRVKQNEEDERQQHDDFNGGINF